MNISQCIVVVALVAGGVGIMANRINAAQEAVGPLQVQVNVAEKSGPADLKGFLGTCMWNLPADPNSPMHEAWVRAGFTYPRWPWLLGIDISWQEKENGARSMVLKFDGLDAILADITKLRVAPLFIIGMPEELQAKPTAQPAPIFQGTPADYQVWEEYVRRVVGHLIEKGFRGASYEVGNESEDYNQSWGAESGTDTLPGYLPFYVHTAQAVKAADPTAKVGGPVCGSWDTVTAGGGVHRWGVAEFLRALAKYCKEHPAENIALDFIDWHDYCFLSNRLSDGADHVDKILAEVRWPTKPPYWITEWHGPGGDEHTPGYKRASHAVWNIIREANPKTRRISRTYWYILDGGGIGALVDEPKPDSSLPYFLSPVYAAFETIREMNKGQYLQVSVTEPLVAMATLHKGTLRLLLNNNTGEDRTALIELQNVTGQLQGQIQRIDEKHSVDGRGLETGEKMTWRISKEATPVKVVLPAYGTALVTLQIDGK